MSFDPDKDQEEQTTRVEELLEELIIQVKRAVKLLEIVADTEVDSEDVEE